MCKLQPEEKFPDFCQPVKNSNRNRVREMESLLHSLLQQLLLTAPNVPDILTFLIKAEPIVMKKHQWNSLIHRIIATRPPPTVDAPAPTTHGPIIPTPTTHGPSLPATIPNSQSVTKISRYANLVTQTFLYFLYAIFPSLAPDTPPDDTWWDDMPFTIA